MKTLANCTLTEFLKQTNKIRHTAENFLNETDAIGIIRKMPKFNGDETYEEKIAKTKKQKKENIGELLDILMEKNAEKTAEILGLMCFIPPDKLDEVKSKDVVFAAFELLSCPEVIDFLLSFAKLELKNMDD